MKQFMLDQAHQTFLDNWAATQGVKILDCSSPDVDSQREYAVRVGGRVVADPRASRSGQTMVVRDIPRPTNLASVQPKKMKP